MMTKFNKDMYAQMRNKKDEPLPAIGAKSVRVMERGAPILVALPSTPTFGTVGTALSTLSMEELTPWHKKPGYGDKQKEKVDFRPSNVWDDAGVAIACAQDVFGADDLKVFSRVPVDEVVRRHLHKLVQVPVQLCLPFVFLSLFYFIYIYIYIYFFFLGVGRKSPSHFGVPGFGG